MPSDRRPGRACGDRGAGSTPGSSASRWDISGIDSSSARPPRRRQARPHRRTAPDDPAHRQQPAVSTRLPHTAGASVHRSRQTMIRLHRRARPTLHRTPELHQGNRQLAHRRDFVEHLVSADLPEPRTAELVAAEASRLTDRWVLAPAWGFRHELPMTAQPDCSCRAVPTRPGRCRSMIAGPAPGDLPVIAVRTELHERLAVGR